MKLTQFYDYHITNFKNIPYADFFNQYEKWIVSFALGLLFLIFSSKFIYLYINMFTIYAGKNIFTEIGCIKTSGIFLSSILFTLGLYIIFSIYAEDNTYNDNILVIAILMGTIFFILNLNVIYFFIEKLKNYMLFRENNIYSCEKTIFSKIILFFIFVLIVRIMVSNYDF